MSQQNGKGKWWQIDLKKEYHLEKILYFPPEKPQHYSRDLTFRFGNDSDALSLENQVVFTHPEIVPDKTILVINASSMASGRYLSITSDLKFNLGMAAIQVITKEDFA